MADTNEKRLLSVEDLSVSFGVGAREVKAVRNVPFTVDKGETVALVAVFTPSTSSGTARGR